MHIVYIKESFNNISEAKTDRFGVAVLGFFFQVISHSLTFLFRHTNLYVPYTYQV